MSIQIEISQEKRTFTSVLEAISFLATKQLSEDIERTQESEKNKDAYQSSIHQENEGYSIEQAKEMIGNTQ